MNRRAFMARVFTVAAAASTFALGPIPDFRKPLRACPYCGYKGNSVLGGRSANNGRSTTIASSVGVAQAYTSKMDRAGTSRQAR